MTEATRPGISITPAVPTVLTLKPTMHRMTSSSRSGLSGQSRQARNFLSRLRPSRGWRIRIRLRVPLRRVSLRGAMAALREASGTSSRWAAPSIWSRFA